MLQCEALERCGFVSADRAALTQPTLVVTGGRSHPRFADQSARLGELMPGAKAVSFPDRHHLIYPQRDEPERMAELLLTLWSRA